MYSVISKSVFISGALSKPCSCEQPTFSLIAIVEQQAHKHFFGNSKTNKCQNLWYFSMWPLVLSLNAARYVCLVPGFGLKPFTSTKMFGFITVQQLSLLSPPANIALIVPHFPQKSFFISSLPLFFSSIFFPTAILTMYPLTECYDLLFLVGSYLKGLAVTALNDSGWYQEGRAGKLRCYVTAGKLATGWT